MRALELSPEEAWVLREALESCRSDLRMAIVDTDRKDSRDQLKHRRALLQRVVDALAPHE